MLTLHHSFTPLFSLFFWHHDGCTLTRWRYESNDMKLYNGKCFFEKERSLGKRWKTIPSSRQSTPETISWVEPLVEAGMGIQICWLSVTGSHHLTSSCSTFSQQQTCSEYFFGLLQMNCKKSRSWLNTMTAPTYLSFPILLIQPQSSICNDNFNAALFFTFQWVLFSRR